MIQSDEVPQREPQQNKNYSTNYDPFLHREVKKPTTNFDTFVHCIKGSFGSGVLAMPYAFKHSGTVCGVVGTIILSLILAYSLVVLIRCQNEVCKIKRKPYMAYPYVAKSACQSGPKCFKLLAPYAPAIVDFFLIANQLGICISYIAFIATSLKEILEPDYFKYTMDYRWYLFMILPPILAINTIRNLKHLTPVSLTADVLIIISVFLIVYYMLGTGPLKLHETTYFGTVVEYPIFFGIVMFAVGAVGVVLSVERNMQTPKDFPQVLYMAMSVVIFFYTFMGFLGYAKYAEDVLGSITHSIPKQNVLSIIVKSMVAVFIFCSYPLQIYVTVEIIWKNYILWRIADANKHAFFEYCLRICIISFTCFVVLVVSEFELILSFVGAFCISALGLILPFAMELCVLWPENKFGPFKYILIKDILGIILGFVMLILGSYVSVLAVIKDKTAR